MRLTVEYARYCPNSVSGLLSGASLIAMASALLAAHITPAQAAPCSPSSVTTGTSVFSGSCSGTVYLNGGHIVNNGIISGSGLSPAVTGFNGGTLSNSGTLTGSVSAVSNWNTIDLIENSSTGFISGAKTGISNFLNKSIGTLTNAGVITGAENGVLNYGTIDVITNDGGTILANQSDLAAGLHNEYGTIGSLFNSGIMFGRGTGLFNGYGSGSSSGSIGHITNTGVISGSIAGIINGLGGSGIAGTIGTLENLGAILSGSMSNFGSISASSGVGIDNTHGSIDTLINGQGGNLGFGGTINSGSFGAEATALTFTGNLPTNYQEYIFADDHYGQIAFSSITGTMDFSVAFDSTTGTGSIYDAVLSGIDASQIGGSISGTMLTNCGTLSVSCFQGSSNGYTWNLYQEGTSGTAATTWDLMITGVVSSALSAPELDGSLVPRALLLLFIVYLLSGGTWPLQARQKADE